MPRPREQAVAPTTLAYKRVVLDKMSAATGKIEGLAY